MKPIRHPGYLEWIRTLPYSVCHTTRAQKLRLWRRRSIRTCWGQKTITFSLRAGPPSVEATDETAIPSEYKALLLKLPAVVWEQLLDGLEIEQRAAVLGQVKSPEVSVDKRSIKVALDGGAEVPGAGLAIGRHSLRRS